MDVLLFAITELSSATYDTFQQSSVAATLLGLAVIGGYLVLRRTLRLRSNALAYQPDPMPPKPAQVIPGRNNAGDPIPEAVEQASADAFAFRSAQRQGAFQGALRSLGLVGALVFSLAMGVEIFGTPTLLRRAFQSASASNHVQLTFETATGGFLHGEIVLRNVKISRQNDPKANFNLACDEVRIRLSFLTILRGQRVIEELQLKHVTGNFDSVGRDPRPQPGRDVNAPPPAVQKTKQQQAVFIEHLKIVDSKIHLTDLALEGEPVEFDLTLKSLDCPYFRSDRAPFDIAFRSNVDGLLDDQEFHVTSVETQEGFRTEWKGSKLPVKLIRAYLGGPFRWLTQGTFDVEASQLVRPDPALPVEVTSHVLLTNVQAGVPDGLRPAAAIGAQFLINYLNNQRKPIDLKFQVELNRERFDLRTVESLDHFWAQMRSAAVTSLIKVSGRKFGIVADEQTADQISDLAQRALERMKERRKARRQAKGLE
jgi:hypothetical protein